MFSVLKTLMRVPLLKSIEFYQSSAWSKEKLDAYMEVNETLSFYRSSAKLKTTKNYLRNENAYFTQPKAMDGRVMFKM